VQVPATTLLSESWTLIRQSVNGWIADRAPRKGAALAFYTVFSLAPILVIAIAVAGFFFGEEAARGEIVDQSRGLIGAEGAHAVEQLIQNAARPRAGLVSTLLGIGTLLVGATTALAELKDGLDQIWRAPPERTQGWSYMVRTRLLALGLVLSFGFLLLVSLIVNAGLTALTRYWGGELLGIKVLYAVNFIVSFLFTTVIFAAIYKMLPAMRIAWQDVWIGAAVTALLFNVGKALIGIYLGNSAITSAYGAAGSVVLILIWVYYSAQIFLLGAEFTRFYTYRYGSHRRDPEAAAVLAGSR